MYKDNYDLLITAENDRAYHHYMTGLDESLGLDNSGIDAFKKSLNALPYKLVGEWRRYYLPKWLRI